MAIPLFWLDALIMALKAALRVMLAATILRATFTIM